MRQMFGRVAGRYDLLNRLISLGQDLRWRREAVRRLAPSAGEWTLDLGAGTGDLSLEIARRQPGARVVAVDLTPQMLARGRRRRGAADVHWVLADAAHLPFRAEAFRRVISGFLLRNLPQLEPALAEQLRVMSPGGRWVTLESSPTRAPLARLHLRLVVPLLGALVAGDAAAYRYLSDSTRGFLDAEELAEQLRGAGFERVGFIRRALGAAAIHWGEKAPAAAAPPTPSAR